MRRTALTLLLVGGVAIVFLTFWFVKGARPEAKESGAGDGPRAVASVRDVMTAILDPAADEVWGAVAVIESATGVEERAPRSEEDWQRVRRHALTIAESGNLLMVPGRAVDAEDWARLSRALVEAGGRAVAATEARDPARLLVAGEEVFAACAACHRAYWGERAPDAFAPLPPVPGSGR
jgi:hypothetical protein